MWREVKEREEKYIKEGDTRGPIPTLPHAIFPAHIFLIVPRPHNLSQRLELSRLGSEGAYSALSNNQKMVLILHERKEQEFGGYKAEDRKLIQFSNVIWTSTSRTELDMFTRFLRNKVRA